MTLDEQIAKVEEIVCFWMCMVPNETALLRASYRARAGEWIVVLNSLIELRNLKANQVEM